MKNTSIFGLFCTFLLLFAAGCNEPDRHAAYRAEPGYSGQVISSPGYQSSTTTAYPSTTYPSTSPGKTYPTATQSQADEALANSVRQQIDRYGELAAATSNVQISARNGTVTLNGYVPTPRERAMIDALVRNPPGVVSVSDRLQVSAAVATSSGTGPAYSSYPGYGQTDQTLANQLQQALSSHPTVGGFAQNVRVNVLSGKVTLSGNVPSEQDRRLVDDIVRNTAGVVSVTDQMQVAALPTGRYDQTSRVYTPAGSSGPESFSLHVQTLSDADRALAQRLLEDLRTDPSLAGANPPISINIANGKVTLQGTVSSYDEKRRIAEAMQRIAGVNNLYDQLQVSAPGQ